MNESFSLDRFRMLVRRLWAENRTTYLFIGGFLALTLVLLGVISENTEVFLMYVLLFCLGGIAVTSTVFSRWPEFGRSSLYLLLPASATEKMLAGIFFSVVLYIPFFCLEYIVFRYGVTYFCFLLDRGHLERFPEVMGQAFHDIAIYPLSFYIVMFLSFLFFQSVYTLIVMRFRRRHTMILGITLLSVFILYNMGMLELMTLLSPVRLGRVVNPGMFLTFMSPDFGYGSGAGFGMQFFYFSFIKPIRYLNDFTWFIVFVLLYGSAWFGLKEREI